MPQGILRPARGTLLVARPHLLDPNFMRTVVLLCDHDDERGTFGFVLNRPSGKGLAEVLRDGSAFEGRDDPVFAGGPVGLDSLAILHREEGIPGSMEILPGVMLGGDVDVLGARFREGSAPGGAPRFVVGYSGWGEGQLAREMTEDTWVVCPAEARWVFDPEPATLWSRVLRSMGGEYRMWALSPADPELN
ncbi:MAG: YqgE/AlgH family protein [Planctomycetaceae bacterium]|nr:YqgE/AlgH family protein [Planctomycetota bacterium]NUN52743.1 YqgE/AlgH family protein [Planctomycetaceae bacterium]